MNREKAFKAYDYNERLLSTKDKKYFFEIMKDSELNERMFNKTLDLIIKIAIKSTELNENPLINLKGDIASLFTKAIIESNLNENEKVNLIYDLELNISNRKFRDLTFHSQNKLDFYKAAQSLNEKLKEKMDEKEVKELKMLVENVLREV